jgi:uncharacterized protein YodC (DUF2158 family)
MSENSKQLQKGDVIRLRNGGPKMTVVGFDGEGVDCVFTAGSQQQTVWVSLACPIKVGKRRRQPESEEVGMIKKMA